jgi:hypothetical protein
VDRADVRARFEVSWSDSATKQFIENLAVAFVYAEVARRGLLGSAIERFLVLVDFRAVNDSVLNDRADCLGDVIGRGCEVDRKRGRCIGTALSKGSDGQRRAGEAEQKQDDRERSSA